MIKQEARLVIHKKRHVERNVLPDSIYGLIHLPDALVPAQHERPVWRSEEVTDSYDHDRRGHTPGGYAARASGQGEAHSGERNDDEKHVVPRTPIGIDL